MFIELLMQFFCVSQLFPFPLSPSSHASSLSCSFADAPSAAVENGTGRDHGGSFAPISVLLRAAAAAAAAAPPPQSWGLTFTGRRHRHWGALWAAEAHIHDGVMRGFDYVLRAQETSSTSNLSLSLFSFSSSCCCSYGFPSPALGGSWSWTFVLTFLSVLSVFSLHAGDSPSESLAADRLLLLLLHPEECVNPQLGLQQMVRAEK